MFLNKIREKVALAQSSPSHTIDALVFLSSAVERLETILQDQEQEISNLQYKLGASPNSVGAEKLTLLYRRVIESAEPGVDDKIKEIEVMQVPGGQIYVVNGYPCYVPQG